MELEEQTHFLGIGGIGVSALAYILLERGEIVSGTDRSEGPLVKDLRKKGTEIREDFDAKARVVYSGAIQSSHPALQKAEQMGCPLYHRSVFLQKLMEGQIPLLVTGTHGKTSTSGLLAWVLQSAGYCPSYAIGGVLLNTRQNGGHGKGPYFVAEADESDGSFFNYTGEYAILTNVEREHLDYWETEEHLVEGFKKFATQIGTLFWCIDDPLLSSLQLKGHSYGVSEKADWRLLDALQRGTSLYFTASHRGQLFEKIDLPLMGNHQALNALAVWGLAFELGIPEKEIRRGFSTFRGIARRLEKKGEVRGIAIYDDYAHHPTEIEACLTALKNAMGKRPLVAIFQPHRYSRTRDHLEAFTKAFHAADSIYMTDIYPAGEDPLPGISGRALAEQTPGAIYLTKKEILPHLSNSAQSGDVIITMGAGDITTLSSQLLEDLA